MAQDLTDINDRNSRHLSDVRVQAAEPCLSPLTFKHCSRETPAVSPLPEVSPVFDSLAEHKKQIVPRSSELTGFSFPPTSGEFYLTSNISSHPFPSPAHLQGS